MGDGELHAGDDALPTTHPRGRELDTLGGGGGDVMITVMVMVMMLMIMMMMMTCWVTVMVTESSNCERSLRCCW